MSPLHFKKKRSEICSLQVVLGARTRLSPPQRFAARALSLASGATCAVKAAGLAEVSIFKDRVSLHGATPSISKLGLGAILGYA